MTETLKNGVILCQCHGRLTDSLPVDEICQFLRRRLPDISVVIVDDLCQPGVSYRLMQEQRLEPWVVGACPQLEHKSHFGEEAKSLGFDAYSIRIVDLLAEIALPLSTNEIAERVKLLLWAQVKRRSEFKGINQDKLRLRFPKPEGKISRRELLTLVRPHYEVIPFIEPMRCRGYQECGLCVDTCPLRAIKVDQNEIAIDKTICNGCGACIVACPHNAIVYPTFSLEELDKEMEGLLLSKDIALDHRIIAATCQSCSPTFGRDGGGQLSYPGSMLPVKVPCLAMVSPWLILRAFDMGAQGFALIASRGKCRSGFDSARWQENIQFVQKLFNCWNIEPERLRLFEVAEDAPSNIKRKLSQFAREIARLEPTPLTISESTPVSIEGLSLSTLIKGLANKLGNSPREVVFTGNVPFGKVELDSSQCTGCGLCALNCPTGALVVSSSEESDAYQLLFEHGSCVACGRCVDICPEKCLRLDRILELDKIDTPAVMLFEDRIIRCRECGSPIGPKAMMAKVQARLLAPGGSLPSQFELCPMCKIKTQNKWMGI